MIELFNASRDEVIKSSVAQGSTNYRYALDSIYPLINKFDEQRKIQRKKFYDRLKKDIMKGCLMPPITLAFVNEQAASLLDKSQIQRFVNDNIRDGYVLDGMQRLNTLFDARNDERLNLERALFVNVIIAERYDLLLYRMITLNNGQKPMTARHQIEMLTKGILETESLSITIVSEKETEQGKYPGSFKRADVAAAYTAFLTDSVNNDNSRIIESKLDELLVAKVMDSNLSERDTTFKQVLDLVDKFSQTNVGRDWLRSVNNLIGFAVGARTSCASLSSVSPEEFSNMVALFEEAFSAIDVSKINVGKFRRELSSFYIKNFTNYQNDDAEALTQTFFDMTMVD